MEKNPNNFEGQLITGIAGTDGGKVYYIQNGEKRWILSPEVFQEKGFRGEDIQRVPDVQIEAIDEGEPIVTADRKFTKCKTGTAYISEDKSSTASAETPPWIRTREEISRKYIHGVGIEIGAHHAPVRMPESVTVKYLDILPAEENQRRFPELTAIPVDIIDDGEVLSSIEQESLDFIIANHFLEHCQNPLGTIRTHLSKLRPKGVLYYAVPNKDFTFDKERPLTDFDHLIRDDREGPDVSRLKHYEEWIKYILKIDSSEGIESKAREMVLQDLRIHFHVWDRKTFEDFLDRAKAYLDNQFITEYIQENGIEVIVILSKVPVKTCSIDRRDFVRYELTRPLIKGQGIEIGAGANPHPLPVGAVCEYFDKRTEKELAGLFGVEESSIHKVYSLEVVHERFPDKADFLIAHHVLEHISDPICALIEWNSYVKDGGVVVVSVPDADYCPDKGRLIPTFEHVLMDYFLERYDDSFESREHIYSFVMGWIDDGFAKDMNKFDIAKKAHECAKAQKNDLHWHAYNEELLRKIILTAPHFGNQSIRIEATATPYSEENERRTSNEIIYVYRIDNVLKDASTDLFAQQIIGEIKQVRTKFISALNKINKVLTE
jgi:predicted SAM-dependent methyltransferase